MKSFFVVTLIFIVLIQVCLGHICIIYPSQRGGYNISAPGEAACFGPNAPCAAGIFIYFISFIYVQKKKY